MATTDAQATGVRLTRVHALFRSEGGAAASLSAEPDLDVHLPSFRGPSTVQRDHFRSAYSFEAPLAYMPRYLSWLRTAGEARGLVVREGIDLPDLPSAFEHLEERPGLLVNTLGLSNREVLKDAACYPTRGVLVYLQTGLGSVPDVYFDEEAPLPTYVIPQGTDGIVACGGAVEPNEGSLEVTEEQAAAIVARCREMVPALREPEVQIIGQWAGLRPSRVGGMRVELDARESVHGVNVVHNYGHGGSGVICSWGCAQEVAALSLRAAEEAAGSVADALAENRRSRSKVMWPTGEAGPEVLPEDIFGL